jgi:hypothetical protein
MRKTMTIMPPRGRHALRGQWRPDAITYDSWAKAVLAALHDVRERLAAWVSTHDGLTDF